FGGRLAADVLADRNAAAVVGDGDRTVDVNGHVDLIAMSRQCLVYRIVDNLVHEVVQAGGTRGADVHRGPLANGLEAFEHLDLVRPVVAAGLALRADTLPVVVRLDVRRRRRRPLRILSRVRMFHQTRIGMITYV